MTIFDGIKKLEENVLDEVIVPKVAAVVQYLGEEIAVRSVVHDDVGVAVLLYNPVEGDNVWVG
jgi:hypothetical protein